MRQAGEVVATRLEVLAITEVTGLLAEGDAAEVLFSHGRTHAAAAMLLVRSR